MARPSSLFQFFSLFRASLKNNSAAMLDVIRRLAVAPPGAKVGSGPETILGSALACSLLFGLLQSTGLALPKSPKLKRADVLQWNMRVVSTVHAAILTVGESIDTWREKRERERRERERERGHELIGRTHARSSLKKHLQASSSASATPSTSPPRPPSSATPTSRMSSPACSSGI